LTKFIIGLALHVAVLLPWGNCYAQSSVQTPESPVVDSSASNAQNHAQNLLPKPELNLNLKVPASVLSVPLDQVTVYGKRDFLKENDAQLLLLTSALPCVGCTGQLKAKRSVAEVTSVYAENVVIYALSHSIFHPPPPSFDDPGDAALHFSQQKR